MRKVLESSALPRAASGPFFYTYRNRLRRLSLKVSTTFNVFPMCLVLKDIELGPDGEYSSGSFADVFQGTYHGQVVALKKIRIYAMSTESQRKRAQQVSASTVVNTQKSILPPDVVYSYSTANH